MNKPLVQQIVLLIFEVNRDANDTLHTAHTTNPVPAILTMHDKKFRNTGTLADVAPTILELFDLHRPDSMTGTSLLV